MKLAELKVCIGKQLEQAAAGQADGAFLYKSQGLVIGIVMAAGPSSCA